MVNLIVEVAGASQKLVEFESNLITTSYPNAYEYPLAIIIYSLDVIFVRYTKTELASAPILNVPKYDCSSSSTNSTCIFPVSEL